MIGNFEFFFLVAATALAGWFVISRWPTRNDCYSKAVPAPVGRIDCLDGLRAAAIMIVICSHYTKISLFPGGFGVTIFFVISGYIIFSLLLKEIDRTGNLDMMAFYRRRFYRLAPVIVLTLLAASLLQYPLELHWVTPERALASLLFFSNYWGQFDVIHGPLNEHWSLAVEEHYYLMFPAALLATPRRHWFKAALGIMVFSLAARCIAVGMMDQTTAENYVYRATEARIDAIVTGCLLAGLMAAGRLPAFLARPWAVYAGVVMLLGLLAFGQDPEFKMTLRFTLQNVGLFLLFAGLLAGPQTLVKSILEWPAVAWVGRISFSLYMTHTMVYHLVEAIYPAPRMVTAAAAFPAALLVAWASYRWIEQPAIAYGRRRQSKPAMAHA